MPVLGPIPPRFPANAEAQPAASGKEAGKNRLDEQRLKKACGDFEAIFISKMLKTMRGSIPRSGLFDQGSQQEMYQSLFDEEVSKKLAQRGGIGLGDKIFRNITAKEKFRQAPAGQPPEDFAPLKGRRQKED